MECTFLVKVIGWDKCRECIHLFFLVKQSSGVLPEIWASYNSCSRHHLLWTKSVNLVIVKPCKQYVYKMDICKVLMSYSREREGLCNDFVILAASPIICCLGKNKSDHWFWEEQVSFCISVAVTSATHSSTPPSATVVVLGTCWVVSYVLHSEDTGMGKLQQAHQVAAVMTSIISERRKH